MSEELEEAIRVWDEQADGWDAQQEAHNYANQAFSTLKPAVEIHLGDWGKLRVLDFGAGTGLLTAKVQPLSRELVALDISPKMVEALAAKAKGESWTNFVAICGALSDEATRHPDLREPFDLIVASSVCSFLPDYQADLSLLSTLLRPGGLFIQWDWHAGAAGEWAKGFTAEQVRTAYEACSLKAISIDVGFVFSFEGNEMEVLMGVGQKRREEGPVEDRVQGD